MSIKRIATVTLVLLGYIALAGATQNIIRYFTPKAEQQRYAEVRVGEANQGAANQMQVVICKDWTPVADDVDSSLGGEATSVQDIYYWMNLPGKAATGTYTDSGVEVNSPVQQRVYHGTIRWGPGQRQITIQLYRSAGSSNQASIPCPANGTYTIRKATKTAFLKAGSI